MAIDIIATHVKRKLAERGAHFRDRLAKPEMFLPKLECAEETVEESVKSLNLIVLPDAPQTQVCSTLHRACVQDLRTLRRASLPYYETSRPRRKIGYSILIGAP